MKKRPRISRAAEEPLNDTMPGWLYLACYAFIIAALAYAIYLNW